MVRLRVTVTVGGMEGLQMYQLMLSGSLVWEGQKLIFSCFLKVCSG